MKTFLLAAGLAAALAFPAAGAETPAASMAPKTVGACATLTIKEIAPRLEGMPDSGIGVAYADDTYQVSYDVVPEIKASKVGDQVKLCLVSLPEDCPKGDDRGKIYHGTNLRTHGEWELPDSEHSCGGA